MTAAAPALPADLTAALKRLKMAAMRRLAPELLVTAKTQRWSPEEFLRTLVEAEIAARDASNAATRRRQAGFPVAKTLHDYDLTASSVPQATFDYLASLEWVRAAENLCLIGPAGTGKSHLLLALGSAAVDAGHKVRYLTAADLVDTLYRGLADNSVGKVIDNLLRNDLIICDELGFAPLDDTAAQLLFRIVAAAYERRSLGIGSHWPFESWGGSCPNTPPPCPCSTGSSTTATPSSPTASPTGCDKPDSEEEPRSTSARNPMTRSGDFSWPPAVTTNWPLTESRA